MLANSIGFNQWYVDYYYYVRSPVPDSETIAGPLKPLPPSLQIEYFDTGLEAITSLPQIAKRRGMNRVTLARRHQGSSTLHVVHFQNHQSLNLQQENELLSYINRVTLCRAAPKRKMIPIWASEIAQEEIGCCWGDCFCSVPSR